MWNHNLHFHRLVLDLIPSDAASALDVGTGDGLLARDLRDRLPDVTGIDLDHAVLQRAARDEGSIHWVLGDVMTHDFNRTFDVVASIATVHHLPDLGEALQRLADLTAPSGVLVVIGMARDSTALDLLCGVAGAVQHQWYSRTRTYREHSAPTVWPPPDTYAQARAQVTAVLPSATWRRFALWRYAVVWRRPAAAT